VPANASDRTPTSAKTVYRFAEFEVRAESGELFRGDTRVRLQEQSLQILLALLESPGALVSRDQLRERLWPEGTYVDFEHSLNAAVKRLRAALEDDAEKPRYIETLPRRGYRLVVEVISEDASGPETTPSDPPRRIDAPEIESPEASPRQDLSHPRYRQPVVWGIAGIVLLVILLAAAAILLQLRRTPVALSGINFVSGTIAPPRNSEAYELYLRSLTYKLEYPANGQAVTLLERSTALDPDSARSWFELGKRYHFEFLNAGRGQSFFQQAREANLRALQLAPDFSPARLYEVILDIEGGQLGAAYAAALAMTRAHPQDGNAHFALSYALRYGGMFEESASECEVALKLDPSDAAFRSCSFVYVMLGRYDRAAPYIDLDPLSSYIRFRRMELAILANDKPTALAMARSIRVGPHDYPEARMMEAVLSGAPDQTVRNWSHEAESLYDRITLSESFFVDARYQSWAGQTEPALRLLRRAISNNFCSYPVMDSDPFLANVRKLPEYPKLREAGIACRENFRTEMQKSR